jgi:hypothetical protein
MGMSIDQPGQSPEPLPDDHVGLADRLRPPTVDYVPNDLGAITRFENGANTHE